MEMQGIGDERGTDVVGGVCPVYTSVEVAQSDTKDYQVHSTVSVYEVRGCMTPPHTHTHIHTG